MRQDEFLDHSNQFFNVNKSIFNFPIWNGKE